MKIVVVAPSPVPYTYGGAEGLFWKLAESINRLTSHQAELIKLPVKEYSFWDLIDSYHKFYRLDLSHFDMVISTKYPSWMVRHQNHSVYMLHHLRGLFDTYKFCNEPKRVPCELRVGLVEDILGLIHNGELSEQVVDGVFEMLDLLRKGQKDYDKETFKFPGPFVREIIHFFDSYAISPDRIRCYFSISDNVKGREDYFPDGVQVDTIYPPSRNEGFQCRDYNYIFTVSRLDSPKRIDILIKAMRYVPYDIKLKIAGTGPEEEKLRRLARKDRRIEFLGFVNDEMLVDLYSNALVVLYIPYDEDYGLITIEAMKSRKPVITATDCGGTLEFVRDTETGYVVEPEPKKIADKVNYLVENVQEARGMGDLAHQNAKDITWENVVSKLLGGGDAQLHRGNNILVLSTYSCYPPQGGGQHRVYNLYSRLAKGFDVTVCSIIEANKTYQNLILSNGLKQISVPQSREHAEAQWEVERVLGINLYDVCMIDFVERSTDYVQKVRELIDGSNVVIFSHPYLYRLRKFVGDDKVVIYEAHNVEYLLKRDYIKRAEYAEKVRYIEREACLTSDVIFATSEEERKKLIDLYSVKPEKIVVVPNGVDTSKISFIKEEERIELKKLAGISGCSTILFVGSWHPPNLEGLMFIADTLAKRLPSCQFLVIGSIREYYLQKYKGYPKNVLAFGVVDEEEKYELYKLADIAINPMFSGSGTNIKMLDYMSAGIPVISTPIGARGLEIENYTHAIICPPEQISEKIVELMSDSQLRDKLRGNARQLVREKYSWDIIAGTVVDKLGEMM